MSGKTMWIATGIYFSCAVVWMVNFFLQWRRDGMMSTGTALFGVAAVCFAISAAANLIRFRRMKKEEK